MVHEDYTTLFALEWILWTSEMIAMLYWHPCQRLIVPVVCIKPKISIAFRMHMQGKHMQTDGTLQLDQHKKKVHTFPTLQKRQCDHSAYQHLSLHFALLSHPSFLLASHHLLDTL